MNQIKIEFDVKIFVDQFCERGHLSNYILDLDEILQENTRHMKIYCDTFSSQTELKKTYYFIEWNLVDKSCQTRHSYIVLDTFEVTGEILLQF